MRGVEIVDLGSQAAVAPRNYKADFAAEFEKKEQSQYSGQASPPYPNRCDIQWAMPVPRPISTPTPIVPRRLVMRMPSVNPALFRGTVGAGLAGRSRAHSAGSRALRVSRGSPDSVEYSSTLLATSLKSVWNSLEPGDKPLASWPCAASEAATMAHLRADARITTLFES